MSFGRVDALAADMDFTIFGLLVNVVIERVCPPCLPDLAATRERLIGRVETALEAWNDARSEGTGVGTDTDPSQERDT